MSLRTCDHLKEDGVPCDSPALRGKKLCFYNHRDHKRRQFAAGVIRRADVLGPHLLRMKSLPQTRPRSTRSSPPSRPSRPTSARQCQIV
jgi:hypothetical protein